MQNLLRQAWELDQELRKKYIMINAMLDIANGLPKRSGINRMGSNGTLMPEEYEALKQER